MDLTLSVLDWSVMGGYLVSLVGLALWLARGQCNRDDYYPGNRSLGAWPVAISVLARQWSVFIAPRQGVELWSPLALLAYFALVFLAPVALQSLP